MALVEATNYTEDGLLNHVLNGISFPATGVWLALSTANPGETGAGLAEPAGNGYMRVDAVGDWNNIGSFGWRIKGEHNFPVATGPWGLVTYVALMDALTSGNVLFFQVLLVSLNVLPNDQPYFVQNALFVKVF